MAGSSGLLHDRLVLREDVVGEVDARHVLLGELRAVNQDGVDGAVRQEEGSLGLHNLLTELVRGSEIELSVGVSLLELGSHHVMELLDGKIHVVPALGLVLDVQRGLTREGGELRLVNPVGDLSLS